jgi:hypothetical protein
VNWGFGGGAVETHPEQLFYQSYVRGNVDMLDILMPNYNFCQFVSIFCIELVFVYTVDTWVHMET